MKGLGIIGLILACGFAQSATADVSGFSTNDLCNSTMQYISCVSTYMLSEYEKRDACSSVGSVDVSGGIALCWPKYPTLAPYESLTKEHFAKMAKDYTDSALYDRCQTGNDLIDDIDFSTQSAFLAVLSGEGFCVCKQGYYIQPRGRQWGAWGVNSECKPCPTGGTTDDAYALGLGKCYAPAGSFSDATGSGQYSDACYASFDNESEAYAAWQ